jgi:hypothetical protein
MDAGILLSIVAAPRSSDGVRALLAMTASDGMFI